MQRWLVEGSGGQDCYYFMSSWPELRCTLLIEASIQMSNWTGWYHCQYWFFHNLYLNACNRSWVKWHGKGVQPLPTTMTCRVRLIFGHIGPTPTPKKTKKETSNFWYHIYFIWALWVTHVIWYNLAQYSKYLCTSYLFVTARNKPACVSYASSNATYTAMETPGNCKSLSQYHAFIFTLKVFLYMNKRITLWKTTIFS